MVDYACDADGFPILAVSTLAVHTKVFFLVPLLVLLSLENDTDEIILRINCVWLWNKMI